MKSDSSLNRKNRRPSPHARLAFSTWLSRRICGGGGLLLPPCSSHMLATTSPSSTTSSSTRVLVYSCRVCRAALARGSDLAPSHTPATHGFSPHRAAKEARPGGSGSGGGGASPCTSLFLAEPAPWMSAVAAETEGKLVCPGLRSGALCGARLGTLRWAGGQCSCGSWVAPAIQLYKKALDERWVGGSEGGAAPPAAPA